MAFLYAGFEYCNLTNLGDHIQSIAAEQFIPTVNSRFNRDTIGKLKDQEKYILIMNGWFSHQPQNCFPVSKCILPIFWGFHITDWNDTYKYLLTSEECINYLKSNGPIGCRDKKTTESLIENGINAFYSKCLTLTFPIRENKPKSGWNVAVDVPFPLPPLIESGTIRVSHNTAPGLSEKAKMQQAKKLLDLYKDKADLIITTRLHCALPCIAMGIPVVFFGNPEDYRISILEDIGVKINRLDKELYAEDRSKIPLIINKIWEEVDWLPQACEFEEKKFEIIEEFNNFMNVQMVKYEKKLDC